MSLAFRSSSQNKRPPVNCLTIKIGSRTFRLLVHNHRARQKRSISIAALRQIRLFSLLSDDLHCHSGCHGRKTWPWVFIEFLTASLFRACETVQDIALIKFKSYFFFRHSAAVVGNWFNLSVWTRLAYQYHRRGCNITRYPQFLGVSSAKNCSFKVSVGRHAGIYYRDFKHARKCLCISSYSLAGGSFTCLCDPILPFEEVHCELLTPKFRSRKAEAYKGDCSNKTLVKLSRSDVRQQTDLFPKSVWVKMKSMKLSDLKSVRHQIDVRLISK